MWPCWDYGQDGSRLHWSAYHSLWSSFNYGERPHLSTTVSRHGLLPLLTTVTHYKVGVRAETVLRLT